jgi:hypothetical protein
VIVESRRASARNTQSRMLRALAASCRSSNVQRAVGCGKWQASTWTSRADALKFARPRSSRTQVPGISGWSSSSDRLGSLDAAAVSRGSACYRQHVIRHFYSSAALSTQMPCAPRACLGRGLSRGVVSFRSPPAGTSYFFMRHAPTLLHPILFMLATCVRHGADSQQSRNATLSFDAGRSAICVAESRFALTRRWLTNCSSCFTLRVWPSVS